MLGVQDYHEDEYIDRELVLVKVAVDGKSRAEVMQITDIFRAKIVDVQPKSLTIEITGNESKIEKFIDLMKTFGVVDLTRTGIARFRSQPITENRAVGVADAERRP